MMEKQNSDSPNHRTPKMLMTETRTQMTAVYPAWWPRFLSQKVRRMVAAVISTGTEMAFV